MERVVVFLDYQNVYYGARRTFFQNKGPASCGHVDPFKLGSLLAARGPVEADRVLTQVRIYRGVPSADRDPRGHAATWRQIQAQQRVDSGVEDAILEKLRTEYPYQHYPLVHHELRTLRYPPDWPREKPQEKGVDVQLAVDFVRGALAGWFDVGIIMSTDTDLRPAIEAVSFAGVDMDWPYMFPPDVDPEDPDSVDDYFVSTELIDSAARPKAEVAAWGDAHGGYPRLALAYDSQLPPGLREAIGIKDESDEWVMLRGDDARRYWKEQERQWRTAHRGQWPWCHWLNREDYDAVADLTNYARG